MPLRTATTIRAISDVNTPAAIAVLEGDVGDVIDAVADARASLGFETAVVSLDAVINGRTDPIEIIQSGGNLSLDDVLISLENKGFRASPQRRPKNREGGQDRMVITIAWDV